MLCAAASAQATAPAPSSPAKKKLVERAVQLQMPAIELLARGLVEQPAVQMLREAARWPARSTRSSARTS
ncbi:hypothetical protein ABXN37_00320 [Piscinibacter sakaiensis]|uniref:hypothetical protein n=1 Tax=Piscinibacter sakaiensis TaxID=1547922 RepID=UPI003728EB2D